MSKFWAQDSSSDSGSGSDSDSDSSSNSDSSASSSNQKKAGDTKDGNRWVMDSDSSSDDEVRVVKSAKDKVSVRVGERRTLDKQNMTTTLTSCRFARRPGETSRTRSPRSATR